jgi:hypothetical protein
VVRFYHLSPDFVTSGHEIGNPPTIILSLSSAKIFSAECIARMHSHGTEIETMKNPDNSSQTGCVTGHPDYSSKSKRKFLKIRVIYSERTNRMPLRALRLYKTESSILRSENSEK